MGYRPLRYTRITNPFAAPGSYASDADAHGPAGHHTGIDFGKHLLPLIEINRKPVRSSTPGTVKISTFDKTLGNYVGVYFARDDVLITYWHLFDRAVIVGQRVERGDVLGHVGSSGNSTAPHLHVQANRGQTFDYDGHIPPGHWVRGPIWAGAQRVRANRKKG